MHEKNATTSNVLLVSAPGKVILFGEHAVNYGKPAIAASINLRTYARFQPSIKSDTFHVWLNLPDIHATPFNLKRDDLNLLASDRNTGPFSPTIPSTIEAKLIRMVPEKQEATRQAIKTFLYLYVSICTGLPAVSVSIRSSLPIGAGLGSSASYCVATAAGLLVLAGHGDDPALVNKWAFLAEKLIHGTTSGVDNSLATYGGAKLFFREQLEPMQGWKSLQVLLTNTGVTRNTKDQVERFWLKTLKFPAVMNPLLDAIEGIVQACRSSLINLEMTKISEREMHSDLGDLIDMNHLVLSACGVSHPTLETVRHISSSYGLRSKMTGAGGGGCAVTLIPPGTAPGTIDCLKARLSTEGFVCYETELGGEGFQVHIGEENDWTDFDSLELDKFVAASGERSTKLAVNRLSAH